MIAVVAVTGEQSVQCVMAAVVGGVMFAVPTVILVVVVVGAVFVNMCRTVGMGVVVTMTGAARRLVVGRRILRRPHTQGSGRCQCDATCGSGKFHGKSSKNHGSRFCLSTLPGRGQHKRIETLRPRTRVRRVIPDAARPDQGALRHSPVRTALPGYRLPNVTVQARSAAQICAVTHQAKTANGGARVPPGMSSGCRTTARTVAQHGITAVGGCGLM